jgi:serine phosphatase RsbU (regulator of sigma subunit)
MAVYGIYFLGLAIAGVWLYLHPHYGLKTLLALWGLLLETQLPPSVVYYLAYRAGLHGAIPAPPVILAACKWAGGILMLRALLGLTLWERPRRLREYFLGALFVASLMLPLLFRPGERIAVLLLGPAGYREPGDWVFALMALPWLWWFRWKARLTAKWYLIAVATSVISLGVLLFNAHVAPTLDGDTAHLGGGMFLGFGQSSLLREAQGSGFLGLAWQAKEHCEIYALFVFLSLIYHLRLFVHRIGRRMVVSHLLAGLIPAGLAVLFMVILAALSLATYRASAAVRYAAEASDEMRTSLAQQLASTEDVTKSAFPIARRGGIILVRQGATVGHPSGAPFDNTALDSLLMAAEPTRATPLLLVGPDVFVRARLDTIMEGLPTRLEAFTPLDSLWMERASQVVGRPVRLHPNQVCPGFGLTTDINQPSARPLGPVSTAGHRVLGVGIISCLWWDGKSLQEASIPISSDASLGESILGRQSLAFENIFVWFQLSALWLIAVGFVITVWWIGAMVVGMGGNISRAVQALTAGTAAIGRGDLAYRIAVEGKDELWSVADSFNQMAKGLERSREIELAKERLEKELEIARQVQQNLFPRELPASPGWEFAAICRPARQVGGDYYDLFEISRDEIAFALGDVCGKGLGPALLMSNVQAMIRSGLRQSATDISDLTRDLNEHLLSSTSSDMFITLFVGVLNTKSGRLRYVNGGHNPPMVLTASGQEPVTLRKGGPLVGIIPGVHFEQGEALLEPGCLLVLFSDGITEAASESGDMFGEERLVEALKESRSLPASAVLAHVIEAVDRFAGKSEQADDMSVVVIRHHAASGGIAAQGP